MLASAPSLYPSPGASALTRARRVGKALLRRGLAPALYRAGLAPAVRSARRGVCRSGRLLILVYHRVGDPEPQRLRYLSETLTVSSARFDAQMAYLARHHVVLPLDRAFAAMRDGSLPAEDAVAITFDDGYRDNLTNALPMLRRYGLPATIFVATDHIGTGVLTWYDRLVPLIESLDPAALDRRAGLVPIEMRRLIDAYGAAPVPRRKALINQLSEALKRLSEERKQEILAILAGAATAPAREPDPPEPLMLDWAEMRAMTEDGIAFGAHSCSHPILSRISPFHLEREIAESKRAIEAKLGSPCAFFAYPNGRFEDCPPQIGDLLAHHGYVAACSAVPGLNSSATAPMMLRRLSIGDYPLDLFALMIEFWLTFGRRER